ncbi:hemicentin-1-like [Amblyomma americanum]
MPRTLPVFHSTVPPRISPFSFPKNATVGQRGTAICTATEGDQPLSFRWLKNGRRLDGGDATVTDNADFSVLKIQSLDVNNSGNYTCVVANLVGSASHSATLNVHAPPQWIQEPTSAVSTSGETIRIHCQATGHPSPTIFWTREADFAPTFTVPPRITPFSFAPKLVAGQRATVICSIYEGDQPLRFVWLKDGAVISRGENVEKSEGEGFSTLNISPLSVQNSGNYTCVVSNAAGSDSTSSSLVVHAPPRWEKAPKDEVVSVGDSVNLPCIASGHPTPTITWSKNAPPKVLPFVIPKNLLVAERISITCSAASGSKPLTFTWIKDGATLHRGGALRITDSSDYSTLSIENLKISDAGNYTCVVSNPGGTVSHSDVLHVKGGAATKDFVYIRIPSATKKDEGDYKCHISNGIGADLYKTVRVTVKLSTKISPFIFSKNLLVGERTRVMCATTSGDQPFTFSWLKDGKPLHQSAKISIATSAQFSTLSIEKLDLTDAGNYTCAVNNAHGTVSYTDTLEIKGKPSTKLSAETVNIASVSKTDEGSYTCRLENGIGAPLEKTVQLLVKPAGDESFKYLWLKDGSAVRPGDNVKIVTSPDISVLKIDKLTLDDAGNYTCVASNAGGTVSHASSLEIKVPPSIAPFLFPKNLEVQQRISVMCTISVGERPLRFAWLKDGSALTSGSKNVRIVDNAEYSTLHIDVLTLDSAGNYTCSVTNKAGYASHTAPLVVHGDETPYITVHDDPGSSSIVIQNAGKHHQGSYTCRVSNGVGPELLKTVTVKIKPPKIQPFTFPATLNAGERSGTMCIVSAGDKPLTFSWFKDGSTLMTSDNVKVASSAEFSSLNFGSLDVSHTGNYTCSVRNSVGSASFTAFLAVHSPPAWAEVSRDKVLTAGESGSLVCNAHGFPAPIIRWFKTEKPKLQPLLFPRSRIRVGESASALCALVAGDADVKFRWFKESVQIDDSVRSVKVKNDKRVSVLTVEPATVESAGNYTCTAENNYGSDANSATLVVEGHTDFMR